jgi:thiol:disulfide interchange protein DsbD
VKYQGCADAGVCYPPQTRRLRVVLPQASAAGVFGLGPMGAGIFGLGGKAGAVDAAPLPPEQAFASEVIALDGNTLLLRLTPAPGYYLYRDKLTVALDAGAGLSTALPAAGRLPKATAHHDEQIGDVAVYFDQVEIPLPVARTTPRAARGTLTLGLQGCQTDGICYPPMTRRLAVALPAGKVASIEQPEAQAANDTAVAAPVATPLAPEDAGAATTQPQPGQAVAPPQPAREAPPTQRTPGLLAALLLALGGGLILNLMPCVLPVLSLKALSLAQSGASRHGAERHALAYTAGVLLAMVAVGSRGLAGRDAGRARGSCCRWDKRE